MQYQHNVYQKKSIPPNQLLKQSNWSGYFDLLLKVEGLFPEWPCPYSISRTVMQFCCFILLPRSALPDLRVQVRVGAGAATTIAATIAALSAKHYSSASRKLWDIGQFSFKSMNAGGFSTHSTYWNTRPNKILREKRLVAKCFQAKHKIFSWSI